jgi:TolB-like protein/Tfp pilus assembly protein PilF
MPSIVPSFECDIFISYRHNDNLDGWVTDFVQNLEKELRSTLKDTITIYFDKSPHDGLLETHDVGKSLEGKLKCLIFIPIISQTYCDTKSFAWQHEFVAFNKLAKEDQFGRDIKLSNGNVASRILPIKIHDLDAEDKSLLESEMGGVLRAIEFIYKEAGVNRPLKSTDSKADNQNKTDYRNQVNKVANAIKEIISAIKNPTQTIPLHAGNRQPVTGNNQKPSRKKPIIISLAILFIAVIGYFLYQQRTKNNEQTTFDKSIAVLPFENMSGDAAQEYFSDGISEEILNSLAQIEGLKVTGRTSSFQFKGKGMDLKDVGEKLGVATILEGSIRKQNDQLRITVQLVSSKDGYHLWSERFDRKITDVFAIQDEIAQAVSSKLKLTFLNGNEVAAAKATNQEAYDLYLQGRFFFNQRGEGLIKGLDLFKQSIKVDSTFSQAQAALALNYAIMSYYYMIPTLNGIEESRKYANSAIRLDPRSSDAYTALGFIEIAFERNGPKAKANLEKALELNPNNALARSQLANYYQYIEKDLDKAIELGLEAIKHDPLYFVIYGNLALAKVSQKKPKEALEYVEKGLAINKTLVLLIVWKARCLAALNRKAEAIETLENGLVLTGRHQNLVARLCKFLMEAGEKEKAAELYNELNSRKASEYIAPFNLGLVAFAIGKEAEAKEMMIKAYAEKNASLLTMWSVDPEFSAFIDKLNLPK